HLAHFDLFHRPRVAWLLDDPQSGHTRRDLLLRLALHLGRRRGPVEPRRQATTVDDHRGATTQAPRPVLYSQSAGDRAPKAIVALARKLLIVAWRMLLTGEVYRAVRTTMVARKHRDLQKKIRI